MNEVVSRFAPSPTGRLHLGHAYSAVRAHDLARGSGGRFLLRIEDIDPGRSRPEHVDGIIEDLRWLGLEWDGEPVFQSQRLDLYREALDRLRAEELVYPCFCTRGDIAASTSAPHGPDGPIYPGTCRRLGTAERARRMAAEPHAWRLDMERALAMAGPIAWYDQHARRVEATPEMHGDVVLGRKDAPTSYHLAVTIDDALMGVTDVVRGRDLFAATHIHRLIQALFRLRAPRYHHHRLLTGADGQRLAKRAGAPTIASLREQGTDPRALVAGLRQNIAPIGFALPSA